MRTFRLLCVALAVSACSPSSHQASGVVAGRSEDMAARPPPPREIAASAGRLAAPGSSPVSPPVVLPGGALYVCVTEAAGVRQQAEIEFPPNVGALCAKHPEMGPCQYERQACRGRGGRVYGAGGIEITAQTEAEYDRKVMRVRFKAN